MSFKATVFLLIFCLDNLSIDVNGVLESPTIIVLLSIPLMPVNICFIYLGTPELGYILLLVWSLYHYEMPYFVSCYSHCFKVCFLWYMYCYPSFLFISTCMKYLFPIPLLCILIWSGSLVGSTCTGLVILLIHLLIWIIMDM